MSRNYTLQVESLTVARLDVNASSVEVIVPASNNPHGSVQFISSAPITASEGGLPVQLDISRVDGLIGALRVHFTATPDSANAMDFSINGSCMLLKISISCLTLYQYFTSHNNPFRSVEWLTHGGNH